jgi:hypothetical protein
MLSIGKDKVRVLRLHGKPFKPVYFLNLKGLMMGITA